MKKRYTLTQIVFPDTCMRESSVSFFVEILAIGITKFYTVTTVNISSDRNNVYLWFFPFSYLQCQCMVVWDPKQEVFEMRLLADWRLLLRYTTTW
jgi:hypothetical protein